MVKAAIAVALFIGGVTILFAALKLTGQIDWSWWWVFSPLWGAVATWVAGAGIMTVLFVMDD